ncbi:MAG: hypothetical protein QOJ53_1735 [Sphingomonadales bacterium]|jgi:hypothetical protein|nr:hypothetical protein [Sphingomonadales bacterium]
MGAALAYYRLYFLDPDSGHIDRFEEFDAAGDAEAIGRAGDMQHDVPLELWSGRRKVHHFPSPARPVARACLED